MSDLRSNGVRERLGLPASAPRASPHSTGNVPYVFPKISLYSEMLLTSNSQLAGSISQQKPSALPLMDSSTTKPRRLQVLLGSVHIRDDD